MNDAKLELVGIETEILAELRAREPLFHHPEPGTTGDDLAPMLSPDFWRVGASGRVYSRQETIDVLTERFAGETVYEPWEVTEEDVRALGNETYLYTYLLHFCGRFTRRATVWRRSPSGWEGMYQHATVVVSS